MDEHIPYAHSLPKKYWINIAISVISKTLTEYAGTKFHFGMSDTSSIRAAGELGCLLKRKSSMPLLHESCLKRDTVAQGVDRKQWLQATTALIGQVDPEALSEAQVRFIAKMVQDVEHSIAKAMHVNWNPTVEQELAKVFSMGLDLFRVLHRQQAAFYVQMASAMKGGKQRPFNPETMQDVDNLEDASVLRGRPVEISVFPLLYKEGDERGEMVR
jgi:hypothetical protein